MKKIILLIFCFLIIQVKLFAQLGKVSTDADAKSKFPLSISFQPIFLMNNTVRFDAEIQQKEKSSAFVVGLEVINGKTDLLYRNINDDEAEKDYVSGGGINLAYKLKLKPTEKLTSFYFSPGITLRTLEFAVKGDAFYSYIEDGIEYITFGESETKYPINSGFLFANFGYHKVWNTNILLDTYFGYGYKMSSRNELLERNRNYEQPIYGFNYNGFVLQAGIRFGFQIKN
ncbi:hypothetical protein A5893_15685 [Pedobacter psychrophilus]|uniref:Outer membrane protein beta-barrel domain-containing protein n=1 Tax=Pedobacter psychrophilus TaxID=1826909 RepID=A0A179DB29_9SPHI|nr:hypothetical protein [Pedobacter psychrophilus]OAQ38237.1 hypothetical protein A5893_15685 [Pedobacter psychrophilus]